MEDVTILFADIKGFTNFSAIREPKEVVNLLRNIFTEFDKECFKLNLYYI